MFSIGGGCTVYLLKAQDWYNIDSWQSNLYKHYAHKAQ